jgi:hypothetical protein
LIKHTLIPISTIGIRVYCIYVNTDIVSVEFVERKEVIRLGNNLYLKHNYTNRNIVYLKNNYITEYDMTNAGINILRYNNVFSQEDYDRLNSMGKLEKNILVGKFLKNNPQISEALMNEFITIRKELFEANDIEDDDILSIKKDAVFVINKRMNNLKLNEFYEFQEKNRYDSYINIDGKEFYHKPERVFDVKGFSKTVKEFHKDWLFKKVEEFVYLDGMNEKDYLFKSLIEFKYHFLNRDLPKEYYFDVSTGNYLFNANQKMLYLEDITDDLREYCFINNNLNFIVNLINTIL